MVLPPHLTESTALSLVTLGRFVLESVEGEQRTQIFQAGKPLALITYLQAQPGRTASRDQIAELLWGDHDTERARHSLRQAVLLIRQRLGDDAIATADGYLRLAIPLNADFDQMLAAIGADDADAALGAYGGDFLGNFASPGTVEFEHWADAERVRFRESFLAGINRWVRSAQAHGHPRQAVQLCRAGIRVDPWREPIWRMLLESLALSTAPELAAAEAEVLRRQFANDNRTVEPATAALLRRLTADEQPIIPADDVGLVADFVGRDDVFAALVQAWESARAGRAAVVRITGGAGMGKSRLLEELRLRLQRAGARVALARGRLGERSVPFALAGDLAVATATLPGAIGVSPGAASAIVGLAPAASMQFRSAVPDRGDDADAERRRGVALGELFAAVADEQPTVILIDDMHWSDASSRAVIDAAVARVDGRVLVVMASRAPWRDAESAHTRTLTLRPLSSIEVEELVTSIGRLPVDAWVALWLAQLERASEGNPLVVLQIVTRAIEGGALSLHNREFAARAPEMLRELTSKGAGLRERVAALPQPDQQVLAMLTAAGTAVSRTDLSWSTALQPDALRNLLEQLERAGLVRAVDDGVELGHDVVADAVASGLSASVRREAAAALGTVVATNAGTDVSRLRYAARLLVDGGDTNRLRFVYRAWADLRRSTGGWHDARSLARELIGSNAPANVVDDLARSLPLTRRLSPWQRASAAAIMLIAVGTAGTSFIRGAGVPAAQLHLTVVTQPMIDTAGPLVVAPVVEVRDVNDIRVAVDTTVTVEAEVFGGAFTLGGVRTVRTVAGIATFDSLMASGQVSNGVDWQLKFSAPGMPDAVSRRRSDAQPAAMWIEGGVFGGRAVDPRDPVVELARGDSLIGEVTVRFRTTWTAASVLLSMAPIWQDRTTSARIVTAMPTPVENGRRAVPVRLSGTRVPGRYRLVLVVAAESNADFAFSATSWKVGKPVWNDGNDVQDLSDSAFLSARTSGWVELSALRIDPPDLAPARKFHTVALVAVTVIVR